MLENVAFFFFGLSFLMHCRPLEKKTKLLQNSLQGDFSDSLFWG